MLHKEIILGLLRCQQKIDGQKRHRWGLGFPGLGLEEEHEEKKVKEEEGEAVMG